MAKYWTTSLSVAVLSCATLAGAHDRPERDREMGSDRRREGISQTRREPDVAKEQPSGAWYGWQTAGLGLAGLGLVTAAFLSPERERGEPLGTRLLVLPGMLMYEAGPLLVHGAHGQWAIGGGVAGLSFGAPTLVFGGGLFACLDGGRNAFCDHVGWFMLSAATTVVLIDGLFLSYETPKVPKATSVAGPVVSPTILAHPNSAGLGVIGTW